MKKWYALLVFAVIAVVVFFNSVRTYCEEYLRNVYGNDEDCKQDYPNGTCSAELDEHGTGYIAGPWYKKDRSRALEGDPGAGANDGQRAIAKQAAYRGGFGVHGETTECSS